MEVVLEFENAFDATKYPQVQADEALAALLKGKLADMRTFMDKMKGGVRHMRSTIEHAGVTYKYSLRLT